MLGSVGSRQAWSRLPRCGRRPLRSAPAWRKHKTSSTASRRRTARRQRRSRLLHGALAAHLAYTDAISRFPRRPRSFTSAEAREAIARAEQVQIAYASARDRRAGHVGHLARQLRPRPPPEARALGEAAALDGDAPRDRPRPVAGGHQAKRSPRRGSVLRAVRGASLRVSGVVYRSGFIQCGDDADGDPSRASGEYRFSGLTFPAGSMLVRFTAQAVIDEFSSPSQRGSSVTWAAFYDGAPICSGAVSLERVTPFARGNSTAGSRRPSPRVGSTHDGFEFGRTSPCFVGDVLGRAVPPGDRGRGAPLAQRGRDGS